MSVKLRLKRMGRTNHSFYRLNAVDSRAPRDGRVIEELGYYDPRNKDQAKQVNLKLDRCKYWLDTGAIPSETVSSLLKKQGVEHRQLRLPKPGKPKPVAARQSMSAKIEHDNRVAVVDQRPGDLEALAIRQRPIGVQSMDHDDRTLPE